MKEYKFKIGEKAYEVKVLGVSGGMASVEVNGSAVQVEIEGAKAAVKAAPVKTALAKTAAAPAPEAFVSGAVCSPLPGVILSVEVKEGQSVKRGQRIAVLEAMKMENDILAEKDGTVGKVFVQKGDSLLEGGKICTIE